MSFSPRDQEDKWHDGYHDDPITEKSNRNVKRNILNSLAVINFSLFVIKIIYYNYKIISYKVNLYRKSASF